MEPRTLRRHACGLWWVAVLALALAQSARAQEIGTIAELEGTVEIGHAGTWTPAVIGAPVNLRDELRTGQPGRARVVFQDDSVINVGDGSHFVIDEQIFDPPRGKFSTVMRLIRGKMRAIVSEYYERPQARFAVETPNSVVGVRGTEFVILFDSVAELTQVVGVSGHAEVHSVLDRVGHGVLIGAREITTVERGKYPTPPKQLSDELFRRYLTGLAFIGGGRSESLTAVQPLVAKPVVPEPERAAVVVASRPAPSGAAPSGPPAPPGGSGTQSASSVAGQPLPVVQATQSKLGVRF